jgi:hypothetical protein
MIVFLLVGDDLAYSQWRQPAEPAYHTNVA